MLSITPIKYSFISGSIGSSLRTGSKPTPIRLRSDIQSERRIRQVNLTGVQEGGASSSQGGWRAHQYYKIIYRNQESDP